MARSAPSFFLPLHSTNTKALGGRCPPTQLSSPRVDFAFQAPTMATPGFPPLFVAPSEPDINAGAGFLSRYLQGTRRIVSLSAQHRPLLTTEECQSLSLGESVLLPLLCSTIHAVNSIGLCVDGLHTRMHDLGSLVANSLIGLRIRDLRNSVSHLSRRVAPPVLRPTRSSSVPPPPPNPAQAGPTAPAPTLLR